MADSHIQELVDEIADRLGKGVSLDDLGGRVIAHSVQQGRADDARIRALLTRAVPADIRSWQEQHGITTATKPVEVPPNLALGMLARVCVPLLHGGVRTGTLWVLQSDEDWSAGPVIEQLGLLRGMTGTLAALQFEKATPHLGERRSREATFHLGCHADPASIEALRAWPALYALDTIRVVVTLHPAPHGSARLTATEAAQLRVATHQTLSTHSHVLASAVQDTHTTVLVRSSTETDTPAQLHYALGATASAALPPSPPEGAQHLFTGVSEPLRSFERLPTAYQQAVIASQAAAVEPGIGPVTSWDGVGPYKYLSKNLRLDAPQESELYERLRDADHTGELVHTLEVYYDGNSVAAIAERLHVHRTSLYYRLGRIKDIIATDPLDGAARLELHMAMKTARWMNRPRI